MRAEVVEVVTAGQAEHCSWPSNLRAKPSRLSAPYVLIEGVFVVHEDYGG